MIATRHEDPSRIARENTYALRRILVRRLQQATRGIPRRLRAETHLQFAREWNNLVHRGGLVTLQVELARSRPGDGRRVLAAGRWTTGSAGELEGLFTADKLRQTLATEQARQTLATGDGGWVPGTGMRRQTLATGEFISGQSLLFRLASGLGGTGAPGLVFTGPAGPERHHHGLAQQRLRERGSGAERAREREPAPLPGASEPRQADLFQFAAAT
jgi:hypothetical protein